MPKSILFDTNVLLYATNPLSPFHLPAQSALLQAFSTHSAFWISRQIIREYVKVMSKEMLDGGKIDYIRLDNDVENFELQFNIGEDNRSITKRLLSLIKETKTSGKQVYDANIVATMLQYGVESVLTHNVSDFKRFGHLINVIPMVVA